jgi:hypothetical protein
VVACNRPSLIIATRRRDDSLTRLVLAVDGPVLWSIVAVAVQVVRTVLPMKGRPP